ncbi:MAG: Hint domain-containing protein [Pseudomonadota bacterium]
MFGWTPEQSGHTNCGAFNTADAMAVKTGLISGTKVATAMGWRAIEAIAVGDNVLTFDAGLKCVTKISRIRLWSGQDDCPRQFWPLEVPVGALGNRETMQVLPAQNIMVESDTAEDLYGDPFSLIPAEAIEGLYGVRRVPPQLDQEIVVLHFAADQVVFADNGALFFCPSYVDMLESACSDAAQPFYSILPMDEARNLAVQIEDEITAACTHSPQDVWAAAVPA